LDASVIAAIGAACTVAARTVARINASVVKNQRQRNAETFI
jgi:hypothetical protein